MKYLSLIVTLFFLGSGLASAQKDSLRYTIFGDSYSTFEGWLTPSTNEPWYFTANHKFRTKGNDVEAVEQTWWYQVIERMGGKLEMNNSYSGSTICRTGYKDQNGQHADYTRRSFVTRSRNLGEPDVILMCAGTNDCWCGAPYGDYVYADWTQDELYCIRPSIAKLLFNLNSNYPTARVLFILNSDMTPEFVETVHTICKHYGVECLDLHDIDKQYGHPSQKGMKSIADQVVEYLQQKR